MTTKYEQANYSEEQVSKANHALWHAAWTHIHKQGEACYELDSCVYQGCNKDSTCAFGIALYTSKRSEADHIQGNKASSFLEEQWDGVKVKYKACYPRFADLVQAAHDLSAHDIYPTFMVAFEQRMKSCAKLYRIDTSKAKPRVEQCK